MQWRREKKLRGRKLRARIPPSPNGIERKRWRGGGRKRHRVIIYLSFSSWELEVEGRATNWRRRHNNYGCDDRGEQSDWQLVSVWGRGVRIALEPAGELENEQKNESTTQARRFAYVVRRTWLTNWTPPVLSFYTYSVEKQNNKRVYSVYIIGI